MKKCPPGEYYCNDSKKCKKIPSGSMQVLEVILPKIMKMERRMVTATEPMDTPMVMEMVTDLTVVVMVEE